jgi:transcriptional regulator with XRE-family HTH domain
MSAPLENYLRTYRKRSGFSQDEVAFLLGSASGQRVSRYEHRARRPTLETALAYEAIFQVPVSELFAGLYRKVEKEIIARAEELAEGLVSANPLGISSRKLASLRAISSRQPAPHTER